MREGDVVLIEKGGDVIPKVVSVLLEQRSENSEVINKPKIFIPIRFKILAVVIESITAIFVFISFFIFSHILP